jgi:membrane protein
MLTGPAEKNAGVLATVVSGVVLLFTASGVFVELRAALNAIWGIDPKVSSGWWAMVRERLLSVGMVFAIGFLLLVTQVITTALTVVSEYTSGGAAWAGVLIDLVASTLLITLLFAALFRFLPDARIGWGYALAGAAATAVLFKVGQYVQALYFTYVSTGSAYGAAGSFVVVMLWIYYSCWILFFGAELIKVYARRQGRWKGPTAEPGQPPKPEATKPAA